MWLRIKYKFYFFIVEPTSSIANPVILGAVSAVAILALLTVLLTIHRKKCCSKPTRVNNRTQGDLSKKLKARKIGYDIPSRSKPVMSAAVWQQEENDIADEVKRNYGNISNCSNPVLFELSGFEHQDEFKQIAMETGNCKTQMKKKGMAKLHSILKKPSNKTPFGKDEFESKREKAENKQMKKVLPFSNGALPLAKLDRCAVNQNVYEEVEMEESARSKVQDWVNNSMVVKSDNKDMDQLVADPLAGCDSRVFKREEFDVNEATGVTEANRLVGERIISCDEYERAKDLENQPAFIGKKTMRESGRLTKEDVDIKKENKDCTENGVELKAGLPKDRKPNFSAREDFETARDIKKLIVTRWIDHASRQNKPCVVEEESDIALGEKSLNELEYEEIDSILTSVSRMDERRISKLKATGFYQELLRKKLQKQPRNQTQLAVKRMDEEENVPEEEKLTEARLKDRETRQECREDFSHSKAIATSEKRVDLNAVKNVESIETSIANKENVRQSLPESSIQEVSTEKGKYDNKFTEKPKVPMGNHESSFVSNYSFNENDAFVKYSIVRNFSDRYSPQVYVSLTHIHGLGRLFGYDNSVVARLYMADNATENTVEESASIPCDDDIYLEEMFSVKGVSAKAIINDSLVVEMTLADNDEPELYVVLPLDGLRHKATLIDSVPFQRGSFDRN